MDLLEPIEGVDLMLRHVTRQFPEQFARALLPPGTAVTAAIWLDTQVTSRERRLDRALDVIADGQRRLEHTEWQLEMEADVPFRVFEYHVLMALAIAAETREGAEVPPIESTVVLLSGREKAWPALGEYRTSPPSGPFCGVQFRIDAVYQRTVAELEARGSPLWLIFAPLAIDADPAQMEHVLGELRARTSPREFKELAVALSVIADADKRRRGLREVVVSLLNEEVVMQSWVYRQGEQKGIEKGIEKGVGRGIELAWQLENRLERPLVPSERATLLQRLDSLGPARLGDVVNELSAEALAAWLNDPEAK
jgi:hypothetical protein